MKRPTVAIHEDTYNLIKSIAKATGASANDVIGGMAESVDRKGLESHLKATLKAKREAREQARQRKAAVIEKLSALNEEQIAALFERL